MRAIFSNAMLSCYVYFLFTLFYVLNNNTQNIQQPRFETKALFKLYENDLATKILFSSDPPVMGKGGRGSEIFFKEKMLNMIE